MFSITLQAYKCGKPFLLKEKPQNQLRENSLLYTPNILWNVDFWVMEDILSMDEYMVLGREIFLTSEHAKT